MLAISGICASSDDAESATVSAVHGPVTGTAARRPPDSVLDRIASPRPDVPD